MKLINAKKIYYKYKEEYELIQKEKITRKEFDEISKRCEKYLFNGEILLKLEEVIIIPIAITTMGFLIQKCDQKSTWEIMKTIILLLTELIIFIFTYYKTFESKYYGEKSIKLIEKNTEIIEEDYKIIENKKEEDV